MNDPCHVHPSGEALERFILNRSSEEELELVETHVLACETCVNQLEALEIYIAATKIALAESAAERSRKRFLKWPAEWNSLFSVPKLSCAGAVAVLATGAIMISTPRQVTLSTERGVSEAPTVSEWRPLQMHLNARDLTPGPVLVEVVNIKGLLVWNGTAEVQHDRVDVKLPRLIRSGTHFLRLYSAAEAAKQGELLREFTFQVE